MEARDRLLRALEELSESNLRTFVYYLSDAAIPCGKLERASPVELAETLLKHYPDETAVPVAARILEKIPRRDLLPRLLDPGRRARGQGGDHPAAVGTQEEMACQPNPNFVAQSRQVSDQDLMKVAGKMGNKWRQIGIQYLGVESSRLEQIEEENPGNAAMRAFYTLLDWKNREKTRATAFNLYTILNQDGVQLDYAAYDFLKQST